MINRLHTSGQIRDSSYAYMFKISFIPAQDVATRTRLGNSLIHGLYCNNGEFYCCRH